MPVSFIIFLFLWRFVFFSSFFFFSFLFYFCPFVLFFIILLSFPAPTRAPHLRPVNAPSFFHYYLSIHCFYKQRILSYLCMYVYMYTVFSLPFALPAATGCNSSFSLYIPSHCQTLYITSLWYTSTWGYGYKRSVCRYVDVLTRISTPDFPIPYPRCI